MTHAVAATAPSPAQTASAPPRRRRVVARVARLLYWPVIAGLVALNVWWLWDSRPLPPPKQVERWIGVQREPGGRAVPFWDIADVPHDNRGAIAVLRRAVRKSPHDAEARILLGRALGVAGRYRECAEQLRLVPFWSPRKPEALYAEGLAWMELKRARDAEAALLAYVTIDPNHPGPRPNRVTAENKIWDIYALEDRWEEARELAWKAYRDAEGRPCVQRRLLEMIMRMRIERSHPIAAVANLRELIAADPDDWQARRALARALAAPNVNEPEAADRESLRCLAERPKDPRAWADRLEMIEARGDKAALEAALAQVPPEADADGRTWLVRGRMAMQKRDYAKAAEAYERAMKLLPDDPTGHHVLAGALQFLGRKQEAAVHRARHEELEKLTKLVPARINHYRDETQVPRPDPERVGKAMADLAEACRGMGWTREADAWSDLAKHPREALSE